jgi:ubiquinone/menaquinone biosynthesis C-methylase UbiE
MTSMPTNRPWLSSGSKTARKCQKSYFDKIELPLTGCIHELGCGTGAVCRAIASRPGFVGTVIGSDLSATLIKAARDITAKSGLKNIEFYQADGQGSDTPEGQYDLS